MRKHVLVLCVIAVGSLQAQQTDVLFIGNSYTGVNDLPNSFRALALSLGDTVNVASSTPGGYTFQAHCGNAGTLAAISSQAWDFVVLQEQSQLPSFPIDQVESDCFPFAAQLVDSILANDSCTQPVFYMTWGRQNGDADNCATWPPVCTYDGMQALLRERYLQMAFDNEAFAAPAGVAWKRVREQYPMLNLYAGDGSHPSVAGTYLVANTMYATMFRASTETGTYMMGLDPDTALFIRQIASATVLDSLSTWNIGVNDPDAAFTSAIIENGIVQFSSVAPGAHWWSFGDGATSTEMAPVHIYVNGEMFAEVLHTVSDHCGRTDTVTLMVPTYFESVSSHRGAPPIDVRIRNGHVVFNGLLAGDRVRIMDTSGRQTGIHTSSGTVLEFPASPGILLWQAIRDDRIFSGRELVQ